MRELNAILIGRVRESACNIEAGVQAKQNLFITFDPNIFSRADKYFYCVDEHILTADLRRKHPVICSMNRHW